MVRLVKVAFMEALRSMLFERTARASEREGMEGFKDGLFPPFVEFVTTNCERTWTKEEFEDSIPPLRPMAVAQAPRTSRKSREGAGLKDEGAMEAPKERASESQSEEREEAPTFCVCFVEQEGERKPLIWQTV